jgi:protein phosphatase 1 regulatory subunit 7
MIFCIKNTFKSENNLINLEYLFLTNNSISVIKYVYNLKNLKVLELGFNKLTKISPFISNLDKLTHLYLHNNMIKILPNEILNLSTLKIFYIDEDLYDSLNDEFKSFINLRI